MKAVFDLAILVLAAGRMLIVGLGLVAEDLCRVALRPKVVLAATLEQVHFTTPFIGHLFVGSLQAMPTFANRLLLAILRPAPRVVEFGVTAGANVP